MSVFLPVCLSVCPAGRLAGWLPVCLSVCLSVCLFVCLFVHVCLCVCVYICVKGSENANAQQAFPFEPGREHAVLMRCETGTATFQAIGLAD